MIFLKYFALLFLFSLSCLGDKGLRFHKDPTILERYERLRDISRQYTKQKDEKLKVADNFPFRNISFSRKERVADLVSILYRFFFKLFVCLTFMFNTSSFYLKVLLKYCFTKSKRR